MVGRPEHVEFKHKWHTSSMFTFMLLYDNLFHYIFVVLQSPFSRILSNGPAFDSDHVSCTPCHHDAQYYTSDNISCTPCHYDAQYYKSDHVSCTPCHHDAQYYTSDHISCTPCHHDAQYYKSEHVSYTPCQHDAQYNKRRFNKNKWTAAVLKSKSNTATNLSTPQVCGDSPHHLVCLYS